MENFLILEKNEDTLNTKVVLNYAKEVSNNLITLNTQKKIDNKLLLNYNKSIIPQSFIGNKESLDSNKLSKPLVKSLLDKNKQVVNMKIASKNDITWTVEEGLQSHKEVYHVNDKEDWEKIGRGFLSAIADKLEHSVGDFTKEFVTNYKELFDEKKKEANLKENDIRVDTLKTNNAASILSALSSFPDFLTNTYTAYIYPVDSIVGSSNTELKNYELEDKSTKVLMRDFCFRVDGISIPQAKKEPFSLSFLNTSIKKIDSITTYNRNLSISLRTDGGLYIPSLLEKASGINKWNKIGTWSSLDNKLSTENLRNTPLYPILRSSKKYTSTNPFSNTIEDMERNEFNIVIVHNLFSTKEQEPSKSLNPLLNDKVIKGVYIVYTFEKVRFLGRSTPYEFNRATSDPLNVSFDFIFRKCTTTKLEV